MAEGASCTCSQIPGELACSVLCLTRLYDNMCRMLSRIMRPVRKNDAEQRRLNYGTIRAASGVFLGEESFSCAALTESEIWLPSAGLHSRR